MPDNWSPNLCTFAYFGVQIRPRDYYTRNQNDPLVGAADIRSDDPIRGVDRYCRIHGGGAMQIAEHGGAVPTHCVIRPADDSEVYAGVGYIDPETGGYRILSATQNPDVYEVRYGTLPVGGFG